MKPPVRRFSGRQPRIAASGFTLIEMVVVITLLAILAFVGATVTRTGLDAYLGQHEYDIDDWQGRVAMERMTRELRDIRSPADLTTMSATTITFVNTAGTTISYALAGTTLNHTVAAVTQPLAKNISALTFTYLQNNGTTAATASAVYYIIPSVTVTSTNASTSYTDTIRPRNFP